MKQLYALYVFLYAYDILLLLCYAVDFTIISLFLNVLNQDKLIWFWQTPM